MMLKRWQRDGTVAVAMFKWHCLGLSEVYCFWVVCFLVLFLQLAFALFSKTREPLSKTNFPVPMRAGCGR